MALRSTLGRLETKSTLFLLCDLQDKFRLVANYFPAIITNAQKLLSCGAQLNIDLIVSEQNPVKLGKTAPELCISHAIGVYPKFEFSMMKDPTLHKSITNLNNVESIILFGLETHICIEQTAIDLLYNDYDVHIVADCTTSRSAEDRYLAFQRLRQIGCFVTTSENVIFKLLGGKNHPKFSEIRSLVRDKSVESGLADLTTEQF
ncbi:isochorismatase domain-containing protein 1-like isoform X2 [Contarinia nasturtii]|nr:isochorismatase domain-containing protein 1-like isoform X2 [Contarinia nasturtii]